MTDLRIQAEVITGDRSETVRYPNDEIRVVAPQVGDVQVADYVSTDRDGPPDHRHPWDELQIVIEGVAAFRFDMGDWIEGGPGSVQFLPRGVSHSVRVPEGSARIVQVSMGPPYLPFARDMARLLAEGAPLEEIARTAEHHGVSLG